MASVANLLLRAALAGIIVVAVAEIARHWPRLAAVILFVPLIPPMVLLAMYLRDGDLAAVTHLSRQSLILMPLGLCFFIPLAAAPALRLTFWPAFVLGTVLMSAAVALAAAWWR